MRSCFVRAWSSTTPSLSWQFDYVRLEKYALISLSRFYFLHFFDVSSSNTMQGALKSILRVVTPHRQIKFLDIALNEVTVYTRAFVCECP